VGRAMVDPGGEVGAQGVIVEDRVGPVEDVATVTVHDDRGRGRREAPLGQLGDVVAPRAVRRRPRAPVTDDDDGEPDTVDGGGERQPGRAVTDDGQIDGCGQCSSAAMRRNCSTTSGLRWFGSSVR
jgi:hypothetical protein